MTTIKTSIRRAYTHQPAGQWPNNEAVGSLTLDFDQRHRRRIRMTDDFGQDLLLDLPEAVAMSDGDGLLLDDGTWVKIRAATELIVEVSHKDPQQLVHLAWHLGNRHLPTEIRNQVLCIRPDHVIEEMLRGFGAELMKVQVAFQPEGGAYGRHDHHNDHHHDHGDEGHHAHD